MLKKILTTSSLAALAAALTPTLAMAQEETEDEASQYSGDVITVTATRREEDIQDVAASISVFGGDRLARAGITNSNEIAQAAPNVTITSTFNNANPRIFIRGVGTADFNPNAASPVGVYVDDVFLASTNALQFQLFDVQRVEVLRGPQGTLYGRNTTAGAIKYFSNLPTDEFEATGTFRYGNLDYYNARGAISGPLIEDVLNARVAFTVEGRDGNTLNRLTGEKTGNDLRDWAVRGLFNFTPAADWDFLLNVHGGRSSPHTVVYKPRGVFDDMGAPCTTAAAVNFECFDALGYRDNDNLYEVANNVVGREIVENIGVSLQIEKDLGWATLTSISAAEKVTVDREEDSDGSPNQLLEITYDHESKQFSQELRLTSPGGQRFNWIIGGYYFLDDVYFNNGYDLLRELRPFTGFDPDSFVAFVDQIFTQDDESFAFFGRVDYLLTDSFKISGGIRYTWEERSFTQDVSLVEPDFAIPLFSVGDSITNDRVSGDIVLDYSVNDDVMLYASVARGFKSGGFNGGIVFDPAEVTSFGPETITSYEFGVKSRAADGRLTFNASGFYYDYEDLQVYTLVNPEGGGVPIQVLDNASDAKVYGLEAEVDFHATPDLQFYGTLGLLKTEFVDYFSDVADNDYTGNRFARAPEITATAGLLYDRPITSGLNLIANFDASYRSEYFFDAGNTARLHQEGFWLANARIGVESSNSGWALSFWAKNIFDTEYFRDIIDLSLFGFDGTTVGDPATYGVEATIRF